VATGTACVISNIDRKGQQRRIALGVVAALASALGLWLTAPGLARLWLFLPIAVAILCFAQAQQKT
jgi:hypothetical protein